MPSNLLKPKWFAKNFHVIYEKVWIVWSWLENWFHSVGSMIFNLKIPHGQHKYCKKNNKEPLKKKK